MWKTHTLYDYWQLICSRSWLPGALRRSRNSGDPRLTSLLAVCVCSNIMHGSDSVEAAEHEIGMWFTPAELIGWTDHSYNMVYE